MNDEVATRTQLQSKHSVCRYEGHVKLDESSLTALNHALNYHRSKDLPTSHNVVMRRALRVYSQYLKNLQSDEQRRHEATELLRPAKGVI